MRTYRLEKKIECPHCNKLFTRGNIARRFKCPYCKRYFYYYEIVNMVNKYGQAVELRLEVHLLTQNTKE